MGDLAGPFHIYHVPAIMRHTTQRELPRTRGTFIECAQTRPAAGAGKRRHVQAVRANGAK